MFKKTFNFFALIRRRYQIKIKSKEALRQRALTQARKPYDKFDQILQVSLISDFFFIFHVTAQVIMLINKIKT
jgi:hypothetical protein